MSANAAADRPTNVRWLIVLFLMAFTALGHFNRVGVSVAGTERLIGSYGISEERMGMVYSAFLIVYTICMLPGGWFIDRAGPRTAMMCLGLGFGCCAILTGAAGLFGLSGTALWVTLLAVRSVAGASSVPLHPGAAASVSLWMPAAGRSTANGLVTAAALVGIAVTYPGFGWLMDRLDWPLAFIVSGAALIVLAIAWRVFATDDVAGHPWTNAAEREHVLGHAGGSPPRTTSRPAEFLRMCGNRSLVLLTLSYAAVGYFQYLFFYWMQYFFDQELKLPKDESRQAAATVTIAMALGMAVGGWLADALCQRLGPRCGRRTMALAGMGLSALFAWLGLATRDPEQVVWCFSLALGSLGLAEGIFWTTATDQGQHTGGLAAALMNTGGNGGGAIAPMLTPWLMKHFGWNTAIGVACAVIGVGGLLWLGIEPGVAECGTGERDVLSDDEEIRG
jgi:MFS family permease